jgi:putative ABC transport system permease protein
MFDLIADVRRAARVALASPGQALLIVGTLAVAIGTTTVGFAFADTVFLRGLPIADPERTVIVYGIDARSPERRTGVFFSDYLDFRERTQTLERLSTWTQTRATWHGAGRDPARITVSRVTGDLFGVWELPTQLGRGLWASDTRSGAPRTAVLSDRFWADAFARSPQAIGQRVLIDGVDHEIVGVLTADVEFGTFANISMWVSYPPSEVPGERDLRPAMVTGRLASRATVADAAVEMQTLAANLEQAYPDTNRGRQALVLRATRAMGGPNLWLVMTLLVGTAALVTVIAAVNVASVLLARAVTRQREFALRVALGAARIRVFRQLAAEGFLLAALGGVGGLAVAEAGLRLIRAVDAEPIFQQIVIDWHEVGFIVIVAAITPLLFSLAPALAAVRVDLVSTLNLISTRTTGTGRRFREALVAAQLALAVALAIVGGLVARTANAQFSATTGFDRDGLVKFAIAFESGTSAERRRLVRALGDRLRERGIRSVGTIDTLPAAMIETTRTIEPHAAGQSTGDPGAWAHVVGIDDAVLDTLRVPVIAGRAFSAADVENGAAVVLVSHETARRYYGSTAQALGRRLAIRQDGASREYQIVGVTADVRNTDPERGMPPRVWMPLSDSTAVTFVVRGSADASTTAAMIRAVAREVVPGVPLESVETYARAIARMQGGDKVAMGMLIAFASIAVLFAATGLYGTVALSANVRQPEFATRFALGATSRDVLQLVVGQAFRLLLVGLVPGLGLGVLAATGMRRLLFGVTPLDPLNLLGVVTVLTLIALLASVGPVRRASRLDVVSVLRRGS